MTRERGPGRAVRASFLPGTTPVELDPVIVADGGEGLLVGGVPAPFVVERHDDVHASIRPIRAADDDQSTPGRGVLLLAGARQGPPGTASTEVVVDGWRFEVLLEDEAMAGLRARARRGRASDGPSRATEVRAMIPGRVVVVIVEAGQAIEAGDRLLVIEAMKMQNELRAPRGGIVTRVAVELGRTVEAGELLAVIE